MNDADLEAYLDEALPAEQMAAVERTLRETPELLRRLEMLNARRDAGLHSLGEIWRRARLSCPGRDRLGSFVLDVLPEAEAAYVRFHLEEIGCRYCQANLDDLQAQQAEEAAQSKHRTGRRQRYFQSSAGLLRRK